MSTDNAVSTVAMNTAERQSVGVVALISMIRMFGLFALLPVLSFYATELEGATSLLVGLAVGAYGLTQAAFQIPLGALSDRIGRIPVILFGLAVFSAGSFLAASADTIHGMIAGRMLQGAGAISATLGALIADATREVVRTRAMAIFGAGFFLSFMVAVIAGPVLAASFGVQSIFWIAAVLAIVAGLMLKLLPDIPRAVKRESWNILPALRADLLRVDAYVFLLHGIMTATFVALPFLLIRRLDFAMSDHWKLYVGALLVSLIITIPMIMNDHRRGRRHLIGIAVAAILAAQLLLTFMGFSLWPVFVALVLFFGGLNFLEAALPARISILADDDLRGASMGVFSSAQFLGAFCGGVIGGRFLGHGRPTDVFFVCALLAGLWLALQGFGRFRRS